MCGLFGKSRQGYYHWKKHDNKKLVYERLVIELVKETREEVKNGRLGGRKLQYYLNEKLEKEGLEIGRDKLYRILRENGLLVKIRRRRSVTTNSKHGLRRYPNLVKEKELKGPEEVWVSDITYIRVGSGFNYLSQITDAYSRKLVGYCLHKTLSAKGPEEALLMALGGRQYREKKLIHHSDQGIQYCSHNYVSMLKVSGVQISMTKKGSPEENAIAERINGILKQEYNLSKTYASHEQAKQAVEEAVRSYNEQRIHMSIAMLTPEQKHNEELLGSEKGVKENKDEKKSATSKSRTKAVY